MGHLYVLRLRNKKWYVGYTDRSNIERILEHIEKKGAKWTKTHPPLKKGYLHNFTTPGKTRDDEDKYTLRLMKEHGIENVRGGKWCMVKMRRKTIRELESLIGQSNAKKEVKKKASSNSKSGSTSRKTRKKRGYCIWCGKRKKFDFEKPLCLPCWKRGVEGVRPSELHKYPMADVCHKCGKNWKTSMDRPLCLPCWKNGY